MNEIIDFYQNHACISKELWLASLQNNALQHFLRVSFPSKQDENWKYTNLASLNQQKYKVSQGATQVPALEPLFAEGLTLLINNGEITNQAGINKALTDNIIVMPIQQAIVEHAEKIKPYLGNILSLENGLQSLNLAAFQHGVFIYIPAGIELLEPLILQHWQNQAEQVVYSRNLIIAEKNSAASIMELFQGQEDCNYLTNTITEVHAASGSFITHYKFQCEGKNATHIGYLAVQQQNSSVVESHSLSLGGKLVRSDSIFNLAEENARCLLNGIYMPTEGQHMDHHTVVNHQVANCQSSQDYKGILQGQSRAVFNGKVVVLKDAQHTEALQQNKNILLSALAEIDTKPQLEIFADDVMCSHGATVGQLDEDALFYMATRGLNREQSIRYLIAAFAVNNLRMISNSNFAEWVAQLINKQLG